MWIMTDQDKLVNLARVDQIILQADEVNAILAGSSGRQIRLAQASKTVTREQYFGTIAAALDGGTGYLDLRNS